MPLSYTVKFGLDIARNAANRKIFGDCLRPLGLVLESLDYFGRWKSSFWIQAGKVRFSQLAKNMNASMYLQTTKKEVQPSSSDVRFEG